MTPDLARNRNARRKLAAHDDFSSSPVNTPAARNNKKQLENFRSRLIPLGEVHGYHNRRYGGRSLLLLCAARGSSVYWSSHALASAVCSTLTDRRPHRFSLTPQHCRQRPRRPRCPPSIRRRSTITAAKYSRRASAKAVSDMAARTAAKGSVSTPPRPLRHRRTRHRHHLRRHHPRRRPRRRHPRRRPRRRHPRPRPPRRPRHLRRARMMMIKLE